jgi:hypothetical protein
LNNLKNIFQGFSNSPKVKELSIILNSDPTTIYLKGLSGSSVSFVASAVSQQINRPIVIVLTTKKRRQYLFNDFLGHSSRRTSFFFPFIILNDRPVWTNTIGSNHSTHRCPKLTTYLNDNPKTCNNCHLSDAILKSLLLLIN